MKIAEKISHAKAAKTAPAKAPFASSSAKKFPLFGVGRSAHARTEFPTSGDFGLGNADEIAPTTPPRATCGFCSTGFAFVGCSPLKDGAAVNLTPTADYPVNLGVPCPKGWEALNCLSAPDRATALLLQARRFDEIHDRLGQRDENLRCKVQSHHG